ncbi:glutathione S-transferase [Bosea sp. OAE752]|jgi:glutathione S-transferase|uniref:Glutathione S-transferase n=1 Tax=Bosea spartocytisi TaxID=2773451 RepID=A0A927EA07_9HYPH|nr:MULTISPECIES: glutathione S-transferase [Bosea]MBD3845581.1 glutathione S-transferase [Bosea spartocytisi]MCT4472874.1 glutathione S-transferase [Bosea spartocytisi]
MHTEITLHGTALSGHTHRVELLLRALGLPYRFEAAPADVRRSEAFLQLNPLGQIPVLQDGDLALADSNAIMVYLARRYDPQGPWLPLDPLQAAQVQRWLSIAAGEVMHGPATARMIVQFGLCDDKARARRVAERLFPFMEAHLSKRSFLAADHPTLADLACYSYVAHAPEGGLSLASYPSLRAWLARIEALSFFKPIPPSPLPEETSDD